MFPVGDFLRRRTTPYVNWALIAINIAVFVYTLGVDDPDRFFFDWGFVGACLGPHFGFDTDVPQQAREAVCNGRDRDILQVFTSMFLHGGWAHIAGNMLFLWIFGDNVEDRMGHLRYIVFYFLCGIAAAATQTYFAIDELIPAVGASGAIAGVLGAYLMLHPTAMVQVVILPLFFLPFFVPAAVLIVIWFLTQIFSGIAELGDTASGSGVAFWAHVGGFVAGAILIWLFKGPRRSQERALPNYG